MTYLPAMVAGRWFHLYLILDLYSRKIVGWEVHDSDDSAHAAHLVRRTALSEGIAALQAKPVLHGNNGATLKATTVLAMLQWLGVKPSYSRPRVVGAMMLEQNDEWSLNRRYMQLEGLQTLSDTAPTRLSAVTR
jgi:transposase InsO family protein